MSSDSHSWVRARLGARRSGLLTEAEEDRMAEHLERCAECAALVDVFETSESGDTGHVPPSLMARWSDARHSLRGLERRLIRRHLAQCADCRQDLELLGHTPLLEPLPEQETARAALLEVAGQTSGTRAPSAVRVIVTRRFREQAFFGWAAGATAIAAVAIVLLVSRPVIEGAPATFWATFPPPVTAPLDEGLSVRLAPRPRSLRGPTRRPQGGHVTVIPVVGPVGSLALSVRPLNVPDTSMVLVSLLGAEGDTLFAVRHRQWQFFPRQVLVIDGGRAPLTPGAYVLELASVIASERGEVPQRYRYPFELRPRAR